MQLKNEAIKLLKSGELDDPVGCHQCTVRTEGPADLSLSDLDTSDTDIPKEAEATAVLSSRDRVKAEITNALALDLNIIPRYKHLDATIKIDICT